MKRKLNGIATTNNRKVMCARTRYYAYKKCDGNSIKKQMWGLIYHLFVKVKLTTISQKDHSKINDFL